jgi:hypothetical protein
MEKLQAWVQRISSCARSLIERWLLKLSEMQLRRKRDVKQRHLFSHRAMHPQRLAALLSNWQSK